MLKPFQIDPLNHRNRPVGMLSELDPHSAYMEAEEFRRMANESAMHLWDAQGALGEPQPIDAELAGVAGRAGRLLEQLPAQRRDHDAEGVEAEREAQARAQRVRPPALADQGVQ